MDWKLALTTFVSVFLAELGDKTQLATLGFAASGARLPVFIGAATALVASAALAVAAGGALAAAVPRTYLQRGAGGAFIVIGAVILARTFVTPRG